LSELLHEGEVKREALLQLYGGGMDQSLRWKLLSASEQLLKVSSLRVALDNAFIIESIAHAQDLSQNCALAGAGTTQCHHVDLPLLLNRRANLPFVNESMRSSKDNHKMSNDLIQREVQQPLVTSLEAALGEEFPRLPRPRGEDG